MRVIVDPNVHIPKSLLRKSFISYSDPPPTNLELRVTFGAIAADVEVRPFAPGTVHKVPERSYLSRDSGREPHQVHLNFGTFTGSATLRIHAPKTAHIYMETSATFGQTRIYLPRTFHGPLTICSWVRAPRLSAELRRACVPVSEDGCTMRWFVGDVGAWSANNEHGDSAKADTAFGNVWVGYVGEEEEGAGALDGTLVHWARNTLGLLLIFCAMYWIPVLLWRLIAAVLSSIF
ncbi:hypothetical protein B0H17DRAFT_1205351 [Mycena rosella]|uniref:DUF7330 domain-containing protein n=1 Tax=Mycena rosella TaxID=1033263 RepID=A0AAD7D7Y1_MYCRO|nr:hypothetical protein B0H17DRAFT_1205351 [Mycena rosella]